MMLYRLVKPSLKVFKNTKNVQHKSHFYVIKPLFVANNQG